MSVGDVARLMLYVLVVACGSRSQLDDSSPRADDAALPSDPCSTADRRYTVCNGSNHCFPPDAQTDGACALGCTSTSETDVGLCLSGPGIEGGHLAPDGHVYVANAPEAPMAFFPYPFDVGALFAKNGGSDRVRYADWSPWTGAALPLPTTCPTFGDFRICGGNCSACKAIETCSGRSPRHPWGVCLPSSPACGAQDGGASCDGGDACFVFASDGDGQPLADRHGVCISGASCAAIAAEYPGGASCHAP